MIMQLCFFSICPCLVQTLSNPQKNSVLWNVCCCFVCFSASPCSKFGLSKSKFEPIFLPKSSAFLTGTAIKLFNQLMNCDFLNTCMAFPANLFDKGWY